MRATEEEIESDPDAFDCTTCEVRLRELSLTPHDRTTLKCYELLQTSVVRDLRLTPLVFDVLGLRMSQPEGLLLLEKLDVVHSTLQPAEDVALPGAKTDD